jgi:xylulokinase
MARYLGIDLGTTALKAVISDGQSKIYASSTVPIPIRHPRPGWSEQLPTDWWQALVIACKKLPKSARNVAGIGFSGQMHGLVLLDKKGKAIRPAILWNDARAALEARFLNDSHPTLADAAGVRAMASFAAPKLLWLQKHEPKQWDKVASILAPKDYLRYRLTGTLDMDVVDAAGFWLLDVEKRQFSRRIAAVCAVSQAMLPRLVESTDRVGTLQAEAADALGLPAGIPVVAGAGDAAAAALGLGMTREGDGVISIGTSAQIILTQNSYRPATKDNLHAYAFCLPGMWFQMAALLNGASPLAWLAKVLGEGDIAGLLKPVEAAMRREASVRFLPYLNGERTPHDNPHARGAFFGLDHTTGRTELARAVLEGVALSLADCNALMRARGAAPLRLLMTGGGAKSQLWSKIIASALGHELMLADTGEYGAALGASRLARIGITREPAFEVARFPAGVKRVAPVAAWASAYQRALPEFRALYHATKELGLPS